METTPKTLYTQRLCSSSHEFDIFKEGYACDALGCKHEGGIDEKLFHCNTCNNDYCGNCHLSRASNVNNLTKQLFEDSNHHAAIVMEIDPEISNVETNETEDSDCQFVAGFGNVFDDIDDLEEKEADN